MAWAVLLLLALVLPLHLLSIVSRLLIANPNRDRNNNRKRRWMLPLVSMPLVLSATIFALSDFDLVSSNDGGLIAEVENLKLKIARLESILDERTDTLNTKTQHLNENKKLLEEMEQKIQLLQNSLHNLKTSGGSSSDSQTMITALEEEVRLLWAESRKNNFNYHILESKAYEEENKVEEVTSEVAKMEDIITEQWIQIRQLEQSLQMMKIMISNAHKKSTSKIHKKKLTEFSLLKFIKGARHHYLPDEANLPDSFFLGNYISKSCISRALSHLRKIWEAAEKWHHKLQVSVKAALEMNEFTAPLANQEVVFFLASAVVVLPVMSAWALFW